MSKNCVSPNDYIPNSYKLLKNLLHRGLERKDLGSDCQSDKNDRYWKIGRELHFLSLGFSFEDIYKVKRLPFFLSLTFLLMVEFCYPVCEFEKK